MIRILLPLLLLITTTALGQIDVNPELIFEREIDILEFRLSSSKETKYALDDKKFLLHIKVYKTANGGLIEDFKAQRGKVIKSVRYSTIPTSNEMVIYRFGSDKVVKSVSAVRRPKSLTHIMTSVGPGLRRRYQKRMDEKFIFFDDVTENLELYFDDQLKDANGQLFNRSAYLPKVDCEMKDYSKVKVVIDGEEMVFPLYGVCH